MIDPFAAGAMLTLHEGAEAENQRRGLPRPSIE